MKKKSILIACLIFSSCTISVIDPRISREEVSAAFQQRDALIMQLEKDMASLKAKK